MSLQNIYIYIYRINLRTAAVSLFESSSAQLRSNEDLEGPECSNYIVANLTVVVHSTVDCCAISMKL